MAEDTTCEAKARIDAEANHALGDVGRLITNFQQPEELQLGLQEIREHLEVIIQDNHHHA